MQLHPRRNTVLIQINFPNRAKIFDALRYAFSFLLRRIICRFQLGENRDSVSGVISQNPAKNNGPEFGRRPPHSENSRRVPGAKQNAQGRSRKLRNFIISWSALKFSQPQNETLKATCCYWCELAAASGTQPLELRKSATD